MVPLLNAARERGHEVLVAGPHAIGDMVAESGFPFWGCGEPSEAEIVPIREQLASADRHTASILGNRELFGRLATTAMLPALMKACDEWSPEFILRDPCEYASAVFAKRRSIPSATVAISLGVGERASIAAAEPALESHEPGLTNFVRELTYLTRFPASLDPTAFTPTVRYRDAPGEDLHSLPDWWNGSDLPLVYVTFGTVFGHMSFAADVLNAALRAVAELDVRVLVTVGRRFDLAQLETIPPNTHVEPWIDQRRVFPEASIVVCHGGSGTVLGALSAGVPLVVHPMFADQFSNAKLVVGAGAGVRVDELEPTTLGSAMKTVLSDSSFRSRATEISAEMASMPSHAGAMSLVLLS